MTDSEDKVEVVTPAADILVCYLGWYQRCLKLETDITHFCQLIDCEIIHILDLLHYTLNAAVSLLSSCLWIVEALHCQRRRSYLCPSVKAMCPRESHLKRTILQLVFCQWILSTKYYHPY